MTVKLLTKQHLEFLSLKEAAQAVLSLQCYIGGYLMSQLICICDEGDGLAENEGSQQHEDLSMMNRYWEMCLRGPRSMKRANIDSHGIHNMYYFDISVVHPHLST